MRKAISDNGLSRIAKSMNLVSERPVRKAIRKVEKQAAADKGLTDRVQQAMNDAGPGTVLHDMLDKILEAKGYDVAAAQALLEAMLNGVEKNVGDQVLDELVTTWEVPEKMASALFRRIRERTAAQLNEEMQSLQNLADSIGWSDTTEKLIGVLLSRYAGDEATMGSLAEMLLNAIPPGDAKEVTDETVAQWSA